MSREALVIKAHQRSYETAIQLNAGDRVKTTKQDMWNDQHLWIWCINEKSGEGWIPDQFLQLDGEYALALRDYDAIELSVDEGDKLTILDEANGWYWVENADGELGWVPTKNVELI